MVIPVTTDKVRASVECSPLDGAGVRSVRRERERESKVDATVCITNCNIAALLESSLEASPLVRVRVYRHPHCV